MDLTLYIFYVHIGALFLALAGMAYADSLAWSWMRHKKETLDLAHLRRAHTLVAVALGLMVLSGAYLAYPMLDYLLRQPLFYLKMAFVATLIANSFAIGALMHLPSRQTFRSLTSAQKRPLFVSGALSLTCWAGAVLAALFLFNFF